MSQVLFSPALAVLAPWAQHPHTCVLTDTRARRALSSGVVPGPPAPHLHGLLAPSSHFSSPGGAFPALGRELTQSEGSPSISVSQAPSFIAGDFLKTLVLCVLSGFVFSFWFFGLNRILVPPPQRGGSHESYSQLLLLHPRPRAFTALSRVSVPPHVL